MTLTEKQKKILEFIENFIKLYGYPPSIRDICRDFDISSPRGVAKHLESLEKKGYIERTGVSRGIRVLKSPDGTSIEPGSDVVMLPVIGNIAAGEAVQAIQAEEENIPVPLWMIRRGFEYYILKVTGNSMIDSHIISGDFVIIRKQEWANNGDIVVALIDEEYATLKKYENEGQKIRLIPSNPDMLPMVIETSRVKIQGKLSGILRWYK
ncbi:MAG TPA: transcriptional repressor LexA [Mesotoga infera]|uniref:LexA repressor n=1 Tax=Mesotoga infera TaxID=1236046 RepID=A0A7Z7PP01_9BACT|nr:transcriptional repressor LexA [Mesotoga infera]MBP8661567.1 repressor LexA [Mesotoga sp.]NLI06728.1 repressor LexA [Thermotogaceae bacterium]SSC13539.1 LexA repressor [Mesotoga infera]HNS67658.1 transcriptional repressor LexA [Mesotoga infera]HOI34202.1 transcriptional repressor LexA [Mesotoga infera]